VFYDHREVVAPNGGGTVAAQLKAAAALTAGIGWHA